MKIAYFGLPLGALLLLRDGHELVHVTLARAQGLGMRRLRRLLGAGRVHRPGTLPPSDLAFDLLVSWFYPKKLGPEVLARGRIGTLGVHPSLLPRHRGPDPYFAALDAGDTVTGVTAHRLDVEYDTGAMLGREELGIDPSWDAWTLARKLDRPSLRVLRRVAAAFADDPATVREMPQDEAQATHAPAPSEEDLELDLRATSAERALRRIRAAAPWPGAWFGVGEESVVVERAMVAAAAPALAAGELAVTADGAVLLGCREGALRIDRVRLEADALDEAELPPGVEMSDLVLEGPAWTRWVEARTK